MESKQKLRAKHLNSILSSKTHCCCTTAAVRTEIEKFLVMMTVRMSAHATHPPTYWYFLMPPPADRVAECFSLVAERRGLLPGRCRRRCSCCHPQGRGEGETARRG